MFRRAIAAAVLVALPSIASAQQPCTTDARRVVNELYRHMLERTADPGSQSWVDKLTNGTTVLDIVHAIADSSEHQQRFYNAEEGAAANERAVANLYRHLLGRQPDASGLRSYTNMAASRGLHEVAHAILNSAEYSRAYGDWGVPGSGGLMYCGTGARSSASQTNTQMLYADLDRNRDGVISRDEWRGSLYSFRARDWNGDGVLSGDEVRPDSAPPDNSAQYRDYQMPANDRFNYLDVDNDGFIERNEWDGSLDTFYRLDRNNDDRLTRAELRTVRNGQTFAALDTNGDRRISLREWPYSHRTFDQQDADGDGVITRQEFNGNAVPTTGR